LEAEIIKARLLTRAVSSICGWLNIMNCLAYLITFRTYGSWLPGDERGFVDHARQGHSATQRDSHSGLHRAMNTQRKHETPVLDAQSRRVVESALREVCTVRGWTLHAASVRTNHVHVVVSAKAAPEKVITDMKARATFLLRRQKVFPSDIIIWARHASARYLNDQIALQDACRYVVEGQGDEIPG
jgi:REP element-mobilizing transposase RayT